MENVIIYLIAFAGTGKYTIAKELVGLTARENIEFRLLDNHLVNNPVFNVVRIDGKTKLPSGIWSKVEAIWEVVFDTMLNMAPVHFNYILTNALHDGDLEDHAWYKRVERMAQTKQAVFIPVFMRCQKQELLKRVVNEDRNHRMKMICAKTAESFCDHEKILAVQHKNMLDLDVTNLSAQGAAKNILEHVKKIVGNK